jgi:hypothetical protein
MAIVLGEDDEATYCIGTVSLLLCRYDDSVKLFSRS